MNNFAVEQTKLLRSERPDAVYQALTLSPLILECVNNSGRFKDPYSFLIPSLALREGFDERDAEMLCSGVRETLLKEADPFLHCAALTALGAHYRFGNIAAVVEFLAKQPELKTEVSHAAATSLARLLRKGESDASRLRAMGIRPLVASFVTKFAGDERATEAWARVNQQMDGMNL